MTKILWSDGLKTGFPNMDEFHKSFVELLNQFEEEIVAQSPLKIVKSVATDIYDLARTGFQNEEDLMKHSSFPDRTARGEEHQRFLAELEFFINERMRLPHDEIYFECYDFLYNWFFHHVLDHDAALLRHLEDIGTYPEAA